MLLNSHTYVDFPELSRDWVQEITEKSREHLYIIIMLLTRFFLEAYDCVYPRYIDRTMHCVTIVHDTNWLLYSHCHNAYQLMHVGFIWCTRHRVAHSLLQRDAIPKVNEGVRK